MLQSILRICWGLCFNSLQTGNCIQTEVSDAGAPMTNGGFQFPSNGKLHSNFKMSAALKAIRKFQFPSNGKLHSNSFPLAAFGWLVGEFMFQFPSNGKLHSNAQYTYEPSSAGTRFQFPSNGKLHSNHLLLHANTETVCFNSLQTGNCIQTCCTSTKRCLSVSSFNSLQTGNCIQTTSTFVFFVGVVEVSIPFKRETAFKLFCDRTNLDICLLVSIPFKRETAFKLRILDPLAAEYKFQFPSNGKLHSNSVLRRFIIEGDVEFQFPSNGKLHSNSKEIF